MGDLGVGGSGQAAYGVTGTIQSVYEDLGPSLKVLVISDGGGSYTFDASELPFDEAALRLLTGKKVRIDIVTRMEILP
jgi:hypothetical protein